MITVLPVRQGGTLLVHAKPNLSGTPKGSCGVYENCLRKGGSSSDQFCAAHRFLIGYYTVVSLVSETRL
jgi:hypothetical protein